MRDKKAEFTFQQIIALVLVIVLVVLVGAFVFKAQIINYVKLLPGYEVAEDQGVNSDVSSDQIGNANQFYCSGNLIEVGNVVDGKFIYLDGKKTNLLWNGDDLSGTIELTIVRKFWWDSHEKVANIENGHVSALGLNPKDFDKTVIDQLERINGAKYTSVSGNKLCKEISK